MTSLFGNSVHSTTKQPSTLASTKEKSRALTSSSNNPARPPDTESFHDLGLCEWICQSTRVMGFRRPTPIQACCIPAILQGRDVMGCAITGSGKTAAFALPILQTLSEDPYGIYAVVLTPTRELAIQISEQFIALGAGINTKVCLVIGGLNMTEQSLQLSRKPHIVIATPGRLRAHLMNADAPTFKKVKYLVLDEADRLLSAGFESELQMILDNISDRRQTLLFSATLTTSLVQLESMALKDCLRFDLTTQNNMPTQLTQQYLFVPSHVKMSYLYALLLHLITEEKRSLEDDDDLPTKRMPTKLRITEKSTSLSFSLIIFVNTCQRCQEISETLSELHIENVALHSMMTQIKRLQSLSTFRNQKTKVLICTDVCSRGLDIPNVDLVLNYDVPKITTDYIHRVGRTARAHRRGLSITFITQYDVELMQTIEDKIDKKLEPYLGINEDHVVKVLNVVAKANRKAELKLMESGFEDRVKVVKKRKRKQIKKLIRKKAKTAEDA